MRKKILKGLGIFVGIGFAIGMMALGYISYTQKNEIRYLRDANALLQKDYEETAKALSEEKAENKILASENASLEAEIENKNTELNLINEALRIANEAINRLQENNTSKKDKNPADNTEDNKSDTDEDTLTEKDLQTLKEKILAGEMNEYLKEVIGSMNKLELLKLAKEIGLL